MKPLPLFICLLISVAFLGSCKKSGGDVATALTGNWELRYTEGGYRVSGTSGSLPPGNGNILQFKDGNFWYRSGAQARDSGQYQITKDAVSPEGKKMDKLTMIHPTYTMDAYFQLSNNTLTIYLGTIAADGTISTYVRVANALTDPAIQ